MKTKFLAFVCMLFLQSSYTMMTAVTCAKFAQQSITKNVTPTAQKLSEVEIVIDKLHMEGHTDEWCKANCDPHLFKALDKVSICQIRIPIYKFLSFSSNHHGNYFLLWDTHARSKRLLMRRQAEKLCLLHYMYHIICNNFYKFK